MLPKQNRLTKKEWDEVYKSGRRVTSSLFTLVYLKTLSKAPNKVGISVAKKVAKLATKRNSIKRTIFTSLDTYAKEKNGTSLALVVHSFTDSEIFEKKLLESVSKLS